MPEFSLECSCGTHLEGQVLEQIWPPFDCCDVCPHCAEMIPICAIPTVDGTEEVEIKVGHGMTRHMEEECEELPMADDQFNDTQASSMRKAAARIYNQLSDERLLQVDTSDCTNTFQQHQWTVTCSYCAETIETHIKTHGQVGILAAINHHLLNKCRSHKCVIVCAACTAREILCQFQVFWFLLYNNATIYANCWVV